MPRRYTSGRPRSFRRLTACRAHPFRRGNQIARRASPASTSTTFASTRSLLFFHAFGKFSPASLTVPFFERLRRDLALHEELGEFAALGGALERHDQNSMMAISAIRARSHGRAVV